MLKTNLTIVLILTLLFTTSGFSQDPIITNLMEDSYHVWELMRNSAGLYRDSKVLSGNDFHPASVANIGVGLIALCIADAMGWESNADNLAITTLETVLSLETNADGFFHHWYDMNAPHGWMWDSDYSTIDTDIMVIGAIFCKNYFSTNSTIVNYVDQLFNSIDFTSVISDPSLGKIFMEQDAQGNGSAETAVYNEYMLAAWLALHDENGSKSTEAQIFWNNWYSDPANLPTSTYGPYDVLTDRGNNGFIPSFCHQFNYYYCDYFKHNSDYMIYFDNAQKADMLWWENTTSAQSYEWGCGAGACEGGSGYHADAINNNPETIVSPHIISGFIPIDGTNKDDLILLLQNNKGIFDLPDDPSREILWRYSLTNPSWIASSVQGVDYATMLYGLASLPEYLGPNFFDTYNDIVLTTPDPPAAPSNLSAVEVSSSQIDLFWIDNSDNETGFKVERSPDGTSSWIEIGTTNSNDTTFNDAGLNPVTTYYYRVCASNSAGDSDYSNTASATTQGISLPAAPSNLNAVEVSSSQIDLFWIDNSDNETGFKVERSPDGTSGWIEIGTTSANETTFSDMGLNPETTYYYHVCASNSTGDSDYSNTTDATTQSAGSCTSPEWDSNATYSKGDVVSYTGNDWQWKSKKPGNLEPGTSGRYWRDLGPCAMGKIIISEGEQLTDHFILHQNYPNPFNPITEIRYTLADRVLVTLKVFNVRGEEVVNLLEAEQPAGFYRVFFDASELNSGIYFYSLKAGVYKDVKRMIFMK
jgi:hypothetical protein